MKATARDGTTEWVLAEDQVDFESEGGGQGMLGSKSIDKGNLHAAATRTIQAAEPRTVPVASAAAGEGVDQGEVMLKLADMEDTLQAQIDKISERLQGRYGGRPSEMEALCCGCFPMSLSSYSRVADASRAGTF